MNEKCSNLILMVISLNFVTCYVEDLKMCYFFRLYDHMILLGLDSQIHSYVIPTSPYFLLWHTFGAKFSSIVHVLK